MTDETQELTEQAKAHISFKGFAMIKFLSILWRILTMQAIETIALTKQYKDFTAVDKLDLEIRQGELFSLLGVNGA